VTLIPGDGIGPEVVAAARRVLDRTDANLVWDECDVDGALASIREHGVALKGPLSTRTRGARSVNLALRAELDLFAGIRPARNLTGGGLDVVVVRMNTEDLYAGIEYAARSPEAAELRALVSRAGGPSLGKDTGLSLKPLSASAARRTARRAFEYARSEGRSKVTAVHKATVMRYTDGVFLEAAREVASNFPDTEFADVLVDTACHQLVRRPADYDVLLCPMLYGDVLADLAAALAGGIGLAPGANVGDDYAVFEAVHGTAPRRAGTGRANPMGLILSGAMLLRHLGESAEGARVEQAVADVLADGRTLTYDLSPGRAAGTAEVADAIIEAMKRPPRVG
jgi:isocitrate dehydrogenase (NAD+)